MAYAESPKGLSKWQQVVRNAKAFGTFLYDKEKGEVMGRNAESWGKITVFFIIFYLCLAAFFAGMFNAFLSTMPAPKDGPKFTQYLGGKSALRTYPSHKISDFDKKRNSTYLGYVNSINAFLAPYKNQVSDSEFAAEYCNFTSTAPMASDQKKQCRFDLTQLGPCYSDEKDFSYGYGDGAPCFFLKMNKVYGWVPEPDDDLSYIKLDCGSDAKVYPEQTPGFPVNFFPFRGQDKWLSPIVAVQINGTKDMQAKCSAYAKNVKRSTTYLLERGAYNRIRIEIK